jgi:carbonic anhydrase/acetyltransferase-like protein (isoleucine patch superfamily)
MNRLVVIERTFVLGGISYSHGCEYEDNCLLGCCAVYSGRN